MEHALADFDRLFDELIDAPPERPVAPAAGPVSAGARAQRGRASLAPGATLQRAMKLFYCGEYGRCLSLLEKSGEGRSDPRTAAFWGASLALVRGELDTGLKACVEAVRAGQFLPDVYCALGTALLRTGDRGKARAAFLKGLAVEPRHSQLRARLRAMGLRRTPVLSFLSRSHPLNRLLGACRAHVLGNRGF